MSSEGVLIHAFGNDSIDYYLLADCAAKLARKHLNLPVAIVTDKPYAIKEADYLIEATSEIQQERTLKSLKYNYKNDTRVHSYDLTPFDKTLLIDSDYLIMSPTMKNIFKTKYDFVAPTLFSNPDRPPQSGYIHNGLTQAWATVVYFTKGEEAKKTFDYWKMAQDNWEFYKTMLNVYGYYRNDFSLSLALHSVGGYTLAYGSWFSLLTVPTRYDILSIDFDTTEIILGTNENKIVRIINRDVHIMDKIRLCEIFKEKLVT